MNGLEQKLGDRVDFVRLNLRSAVGHEVAEMYSVRFAGTHVLLSKSGLELYRVHGHPDGNRIIELIGTDLETADAG